MNTYTYTGLDKNGRRVAGQIDGEDAAGIRKHLKDRGIYVIGVSEHSSFMPSFNLGIKESDIVLAMRELATFVSSNLPLDECLTGVTSQMRPGRLKKVFEDIQRKIREGKSFSEALKDFPQVFSDMIISMVRAGEETGTLDRILVRISDFLEKRQTFKNKIKSTMSYPVFMLVVSAAVFIFLLSFVTPTITRIFSQINMDLPVPTLILMKISGFFKAGWFYMVLGIILLYSGIRRFFTTSRGAMVMDAVRF